MTDVDWSGKQGERTQLPKLRDLMNQTFFIISFEMKESKSGKAYPYAFVTTDRGVYITSSSYCVEDLAKMAPLLSKGNRVKVKLVVEGRGYRFVAP